MRLDEQLRLLQEAQGDPAMLALATVDLAYASLPAIQKQELKEALQGAAIPHWCDENVLAAVVGCSQEVGATRLQQLRRLTVVEPFPARGPSAVNVHEAARLAIRKAVASNHPAQFRAWSARAAKHFETDLSPAGRIEWIYHLMSGDPNRGAVECEALNRNWIDVAHPEDHQALALALAELDDCELVFGAARVEALLCITDALSSKGETACPETVEEIIQLARTAGVSSGEAHAYCLLGDSFSAYGKSSEALAAYREFLRIVDREYVGDPQDDRWRRRLVLAHSRIGGALRSQGKLDESRQEYQAELDLCRQFESGNTDNLSWQRLLSVAHSEVGEVFRAQGELVKARGAHEDSLAISRRLVDFDPANSEWQHDFAIAHINLGDVLQAEGRLTEAEEAYRNSLAISRRLAEMDSTNAGWQRDLAIAHINLGSVLQAQEKLAEAEESFRHGLAISQRLVDLNPANADWQHDFAIAHNHLGSVLQAQEKLSEAELAYGGYLAIIQRLVELGPANADWQYDFAIAHINLGDVLQAQGRLTEAEEAFGHGLEIIQRLVELDPGNRERWLRELGESSF